MATSVAFLGNAVKTLQAADVITYRRTDGPRLPIFLAEATGRLADRPVARRPDSRWRRSTCCGALHMFVLKPSARATATGRSATTRQRLPT